MTNRPTYPSVEWSGGAGYVDNKRTIVRFSPLFCDFCAPGLIIGEISSSRLGVRISLSFHRLVRLTAVYAKLLYPRNHVGRKNSVKHLSCVFGSFGDGHQCWNLRGSLEMASGLKKVCVEDRTKKSETLGRKQ